MKNIYEVFEEFKKAPTHNEKISVLQRNSTWALRVLLQGTFDPNIKFVIDRVPYYKPDDSPPGLSFTSMHQELQRIYLFQEGNPRTSPNLSMDRREKILIQMLEGLEAKEAVVLMNMILKDQKVPGLDYDIVSEAFPSLLPPKPVITKGVKSGKTKKEKIPIQT
jgi:hypothetical protein